MDRVESATDGVERLSAHELAAAAIMADLAVGVVVVAKVTALSGLTTIIGAVPFAVLALRHRRRVVVVAFWIATILTFLVGGLGSAVSVIAMAVFGGAGGSAVRRGHGLFRRVVSTAVWGWALLSSVTLAFLALLPGLRELNLDAARTQWTGTSRAAERVGLGGVTDALDGWVRWSLDAWYLSIPLIQFVAALFFALVIGQVAKPTIERVSKSLPDRPPPTVSIEAVDGATGLVVLTGPNGSGKSTLLRSVATHHGDQLGKPGGVRWIGQRPDTQVLGARVVDDLAWGRNPRPSPAEVDQVLDRVGLDGYNDRETSTLSGGELQRLAIAAALLGEPSLLLSDETTAMLDPQGRRAVGQILSEIAASGTVVIHATHLAEDRARADAEIQLGSVRA